MIFLLGTGLDNFPTMCCVVLCCVVLCCVVLCCVVLCCVVLCCVPGSWPGAVVECVFSPFIFLAMVFCIWPK